MSENSNLSNSNSGYTPQGQMVAAHWTAFAARILDDSVIYPVVDTIRTAGQREYPEILRNNFQLGREAAGVINEYWHCVSNFIDRLLQVFYPNHPAPPSA